VTLVNDPPPLAGYDGNVTTLTRIHRSDRRGTAAFNPGSFEILKRDARTGAWTIVRSAFVPDVSPEPREQPVEERPAERRLDLPTVRMQAVQ